MKKSLEFKKIKKGKELVAITRYKEKNLFVNMQNSYGELIFLLPSPSKEHILAIRKKTESISKREKENLSKRGIKEPAEKIRFFITSFNLSKKQLEKDRAEASGIILKESKRIINFDLRVYGKELIGKKYGIALFSEFLNHAKILGLREISGFVVTEKGARFAKKAGFQGAGSKGKQRFKIKGRKPLPPHKIK